MLHGRLARLASEISRQLDRSSPAHAKVREQLSKTRVKVRQTRETVCRQLVTSLLQMLVGELSSTANELHSKVHEMWSLTSAKASRVGELHNSFDALEAVFSRAHTKNGRHLDAAKAALPKAIEDDLRHALRELFDTMVCRSNSNPGPSLAL